ncbi:MAG: aminopeptidase [bacterium]
MTTKQSKAANIVIKNCLGIKKSEKVIVVTDKPCRAVGTILWEKLHQVTDPLFIEIKPRQIHGEEPPALVAELLKKSHVFIMPTSKSLSHTTARIEACRNGTRGVTMPGITLEMFERTINVDYKRIAHLTVKIAKLLSKAKQATITTRYGTRLNLYLSGRNGCIDTGFTRKPGQFSNLPAGEAYIAPLEAQSHGSFAIDGSFAPIGLLDGKVFLEIKNGQIINIQGNRKLKSIFAEYGKKERTLCEFGVGTNYEAKITGEVLEDEKVRGSIHIAFGNNLGFGGRNKARIHLDGVIKAPNVWLDEKLIIKKGKYLI